jgi:hypothetical protein
MFSWSLILVQMKSGPDLVVHRDDEVIQHALST